jgi:hypothetical protein
MHLLKQHGAEAAFQNILIEKIHDEPADEKTVPSKPQTQANDCYVS